MGEQRRLTRSRYDRKIAGVCGGIADYLGIDPTIVRILFVVGFFVAGQSLLLYIILAIFMPEE
jgi:phage shock protein C